MLRNVDWRRLKTGLSEDVLEVKGSKKAVDCEVRQAVSEDESFVSWAER